MIDIINHIKEVFQFEDGKYKGLKETVLTSGKWIIRIGLVKSSVNGNYETYYRVKIGENFDNNDLTGVKPFKLDWFDDDLFKVYIKLDADVHEIEEIINKEFSKIPCFKQKLRNYKLNLIINE